VSLLQLLAQFRRPIAGLWLDGLDRDRREQFRVDFGI
jgi:hypothetical protein